MGSLTKGLGKTRVKNLFELFQWWESSNHGKNSQAYVAQGAKIRNCSFITSIENIAMGKGSGLYDLSGLVDIKPKKFGQIDVDCTLSGLKNVEYINWDLMPPGITYINLKKYSNFNGCTIPDKSRLSGLDSLSHIYNATFGEGVVVNGLLRLGYFKKVAFGAGCKFTRLKSLHLLEDCVPANDVEFVFTKDTDINTSNFSGFNHLILSGLDQCTLRFDAALPAGVKLSHIPNSTAPHLPVLLSKGAVINCKDALTVDALERLWGDGVMLPASVTFKDLSDHIKDDIPQWVRSRVAII